MQDLHAVIKTLLPFGERQDAIERTEGPLNTGMKQCSSCLFPNTLVDLLIRIKAQRLYIVASGPMWRIPFSWLHAGGKLALERWEICLVPSARLAGGNKGLAVSAEVVTVGHPGEPYLSNVREEVEKVGKLLNGRVLFQAEATPQRVLQDVLPRADIIHFACHGLCDPVSSLTSCLLLEPDSNHEDGRLLLYEILQVRLKAIVVSLGACHTAKSEGPTFFPESLAHVLLGAGAQVVIASQWQANDEESLHFAHDFYTTLKQDTDPIKAFHQAQLIQVKRYYSSSPQGIMDWSCEEILARIANFVLFSAGESGSSSGLLPSNVLC
jgi:CHAT domain-containing protein